METGVPFALVAFIGLPGAGKTTCSRWVATEANAEVVSSGDLVRRGLNDPELRGMFERCLRGGLAPTRALSALVAEALRERTAPLVLLDGFPRTEAQYVRLAREVRHLTVIDLQGVPASELRKRVMSRRVCAECGMPCTAKSAECSCQAPLARRFDDSEAITGQRLRNESRHLARVRARAAGEGRLATIDVRGPLHEARNAVLAAISTFVLT